MISTEISGPYDDGEGREFWCYKVVEDQVLKGFGSDYDLANTLNLLDETCKDKLGKPLAHFCECGSRSLYKPFTPGHSHWCPVSHLSIKPPQIDDSYG